ncbi:hypothetical protein S7711_05710 [Stachybotrys chartarum IBT 7711]|uniref:Uncharacterized protein n=1 Tax=Stachybotrys chartarum (strain CBS 109288 / IBT 7711) TaxID=1280523 RepID=A0A084AVR7_STACB|nr:hypothetical protein S7711_05710 [Stachybotrys chartarum IBT 7711]
MSNIPVEVVDILGSPTQVVAWIEAHETDSQESHASEIFQFLLGQAAQPRSVSGSACVKLHGFVEQASRAESEAVSSWAFSPDVTVRLFNFYVEWNESDQHRAMKLVLDLIVQLTKQNPDQKEARATQQNLLDTIMSIVVGSSTRPAVKSAIKTLEYFLVKNIFTLDDVKSKYSIHRQLQDEHPDSLVWKMLMTDVFQWMRIAYVSPTAGKFIVYLYREVRRTRTGELTTDAWISWLIESVTEDASLIEAVKNYIFLPFFKTDRGEALHFLREISESETITKHNSQDLNIPALLQLAALETGKRVGFVEEPHIGARGRLSKECSSIILHEEILQNVLSHPSNEVRSLALSLLVTSPSTTRPYSSSALDLLRKHLGSYLAGSDAKFRMDVSGKIRDMFRRVRGAISVLKRSIPRARAKAKKTGQSATVTLATDSSQPIFYHSNLISLPEGQLMHCLAYHEAFLKWYIGFLRDELIPTASYPRHIASLKAVRNIFRLEADSSKSWETPEDQELFFDLFDQAWLRALFDLVMDPFDDVRDASASALQTLFRDQRYRNARLFVAGSVPSPSEELEELLRRAEELARRTSRADHSDGTARIHQLVYLFLANDERLISHLAGLIAALEEKVAAAEKDLGAAVLDAPLHSSFASMCYVWQVLSGLRFPEDKIEAIRELQSRAVACCERAWDAVKHILCDDSPEGHLPHELEDVAGLDTKDILSYSFRAVHESSNLMKVMIVATKNGSQKGCVSPARDVFTRIGSLTFTQLSSLRHRGAFTTVSSTFTSCCQQTKYLEQSPDDEPLLTLWYKGTLDAILSQVSTTRRSAGIPSLITGILSANADRPSFKDVIAKLIQIASIEARVTETDGSNLPQVHAYNCLKDIYKNSLLASMGNQSEKYLPQCLELAAGGLKSEVWAIRNCGLIFLRSLIDCLFGNHESKSMIEAGWDGKANRIPYHRYPNLPRVLVNILRGGYQAIATTSTGSSAAESVFPALDIVRRAGPPDLLRSEIQDHVIQYLGSPVWHVRDMAARTLCSCLLHQGWFGIIRGAIEAALGRPGNSSNNNVHGALLALKAVLERLSEVAVDTLNVHLAELISFLQHTGIESRYTSCPDVLAAYLEVVNMIWAFQRTQGSQLAAFNTMVDTSTVSALLRVQKTISSVFLATQAQDPVGELRKLFLRDGLGSDVLAAALEYLPTLWDASSTTDDVLLGLCDLYIDVCAHTAHPEAHVVALQNLAKILDQLLGSGACVQLAPSSLTALWTSLQLRPVNPALCTAVVEVSGGMIAVLKQLGCISAPGLKNWGAILAGALRDDSVFDLRFAAAEALNSFFAVVRSDCASEEYLPVLLALYDALNDDDDEVRDMASSATKSILGQSITPIEASQRLQSWLVAGFPQSMEFKQIIANRLVGVSSTSSQEWQSAGDQLDKALEFDDSLFVVEENNLFIDEVRETKRWVAVFESVPWTAQDPRVVELNKWVVSGLDKIQALTQHKDGPLGWASNPQVFAISSRIFYCARSLLRNNRANADLQEQASATKTALQARGNHLSNMYIQMFVDAEA